MKKENAILKRAKERARASLDIQPDRYPADRLGDAYEGPMPAEANGKPTGAPTPMYAPFPLAALPAPVRDYADASAAAVGCEASFVALPMLSMLAGAIGNTRRVALKKGWSEPPILWTAIVGESGTHKSPALDCARRFPRRRQTEARKLCAAAQARFNEDEERHKAALREWKEAGMEGERPAAPEPPVMERALVDDTTIEALGPILVDNWRGVLVLRDELTNWIGGFDRYAHSSRGSGEATKWIEMHGGRTVIIDRRHGEPRTLFVPRAAVSIGGGIQPGILRRVVTQEHRDNGLLARILMAWPPRRPRRWTETEPDESLTAAVQTVYDRLWELSPTKDRDGEPTPIMIPLAPDAKSSYIDFVNANGSEQYELEGDLAAAWSKLEGYAARLALVHHLVRCASGERTDPEAGIDAESMTAGIALVRWFGAEDRRIYSVLEETEQDAEHRELVELIRRHGGSITVRDLQRARRRYPTADAAEGALNALGEAGVGAWQAASNGTVGGRPVRSFALV